MVPGDEPVVVATVTVVFDPRTAAATPHEIATALIVDGARNPDAVDPLPGADGTVGPDHDR